MERIAIELSGRHRATAPSRSRPEFEAAETPRICRKSCSRGARDDFAYLNINGMDGLIHKEVRPLPSERLLDQFRKNGSARRSFAENRA